MKKIYLKQKKESAVRRYHPWVFSGAIHRMENKPTDGEIVEVCSQSGDYLAHGHYQNGSIAVRIFSFTNQPIKQAFWDKKLGNAIQFRKSLGLVENNETTCYRLVHAEGDGLPGLIIDIYQDTAVIQCHSVGMHLIREQLATALRNNFGERLTAIYDKSKKALPVDYAAQVENSYLWGSPSTGTVKEHGNLFRVNWETGQKTGFFLDQRFNRFLLGTYAKGKNVLNTFAYSGGFSIYALQNDAALVDSVDISQTAVDLIDENISLNQFDNKTHQSIKADVIPYLKDIPEQYYDLIVLDPPAFAKSLQKRHKAVQAYKRINKMALEKIKPGGLLFTFSCSQVVDRLLFYNTAVAAALETGRQIRTMHHLTQPPDHPVNIFHPEGSYLKGLVLYVE